MSMTDDAKCGSVYDMAPIEWVPVPGTPIQIKVARPPGREGTPVPDYLLDRARRGWRKYRRLDDFCREVGPARPRPAAEY